VARRQPHQRREGRADVARAGAEDHRGLLIAVYVLVAIVKKRQGLDVSLHKLLQVLSLTLFEKMPISTAVLDIGSQFEDMGAGNQLQLFN
jgi:hypothetical protein